MVLARPNTNNNVSSITEDIENYLNTILDFNSTVNFYLDPNLNNKEIVIWFNEGLNYSENSIFMKYNITEEYKKNEIKDISNTKCIKKLVETGKKNYNFSKQKRGDCDVFTAMACELVCGTQISFCEIGNPGVSKDEMIRRKICIPKSCSSCYEKCY